MAKFRVKYRGGIWDAELICDPRGAPLVWQLYGYPCDPGTNGARQNHWVAIAEAQQIVSVPYTVTVTGQTIQEPELGNTATLTFTVALTAPQPTTINMTYVTVPLTATAGVDFQATSGTLTFAPGEIIKTVNVTVFGDHDSESAELVGLNVTDITAGTPTVQGTGTINDYPWNPNDGYGYYAMSEIRERLTELWEGVKDFIPRFWHRS